MRYRSEQSSTTDYILVDDDDDRYSEEWSDKDAKANDCSVVLEFWSNKPRTASNNAKRLIDSLEKLPLTVTGFYHLRTVIERNSGRAALTIEGQSNQYSRQLQIRFYYHPS